MSLDSLYSATQPLMSTAEDIWTPTRRLGSGGPRQPTLPPGQPAAQNTARSSVTPAYNAYSRAATTATATWKYLRLVRKVRTPSGSARPSKRPNRHHHKVPQGLLRPLLAQGARCFLHHMPTWQPGHSLPSNPPIIPFPFPVPSPSTNSNYQLKPTDNLNLNFIPSFPSFSIFFITDNFFS